MPLPFTQSRTDVWATFNLPNNSMYLYTYSVNVVIA